MLLQKGTEHSPLKVEVLLLSITAGFVGYGFADSKTHKCPKAAISSHSLHALKFSIYAGFHLMGIYCKSVSTAK